MMLLSSLALVFAPIVMAASSRTCLPSGDERAINAEFEKGGGATMVKLCPGSTHILNEPIRFTSSRQTLTTEGNPKGRDRAMLVVRGQDQAVAIKADCKDCSFATIRSLIIDGNRLEMLRVPGGGALVEIGNAEMQTVRDCRIYESRGWSCLHVREGDMKQCKKAKIIGNDIGPCGEEWDDEYDGVDETNPVNGNPRADGISLACQDSYVERNIVTDATDGAIVLFGSAGSEVRDNQVFTRTRVLLGGINLVDYDPWNGDYFGVKVHHNTIHAYGGFLKAGIVVGPSTWSDDTERIVHSAWVTDNYFHGEHFGYALVVASAERFTVIRNYLGDQVAFSGVPGVRCPKAPPNAPPMPFLLNKGSADGTFQENFVNGEVQHIICIDPPPVNGVPYKPWRLRDLPNAKKPPSSSEDGEATTEEDSTPVSFDSRLAEAVVLYQQRILGGITGLNSRIENHNHEDDGEGDTTPVKGRAKGGGAAAAGGGAGGAGERGKTGIKVIDGLERKVEVFESGEKTLQREMDAIHRELGEMSKKIQKSADESKPILADVFKVVSNLPSNPHLAIPAARNPQLLSGYRSHEEGQAHTDLFGSIGPMGVVLMSGVMLVVALNVVRRWRRGRGSGGTSVRRKLF